MFNIGGGEVLVIALIALIVVGPEQLPGVLRKAGRYVNQFRSTTTALRQEFMSGIDELDPTKWDQQGSGTNDSPIVPRGFAGKQADTTPGAGIKPVSAPMAGVDPEPGAGAAPQAGSSDDTGSTAEPLSDSANSIAAANSSANLSASRAAKEAEAQAELAVQESAVQEAAVSEAAVQKTASTDDTAHDDAAHDDAAEDGEPS